MAAKQATITGEEEALYNLTQKKASWMVSGMPFIPSLTNFEKSIPKLATMFQGEFCWATCYDPEFAAELMYNGFLPMAMEAYGVEIITPKLHVRRSLVRFTDLPKPHKSTLKKAKKFEFTVDTDFKSVCEGIIEQHGPSWFYPKLVKLFTAMNSKFETGLLNGKVRVHSFEVWQDGNLVAGEAGYSCGKVYTSLSGFTRADSAGTVQMYAMASHLKSLGFVIWDLGMQLGYKEEEFGAKPVARLDFLKLLQQYRDDPVTGPIRMVDKRNCKSMLESLTTTTNGGPAKDVQMADKE